MNNKRLVAFLLVFMMIFSPLLDVFALASGEDLGDDEKRVLAAHSELVSNWHKFILDSDKDFNIADVLKEDLNKYGYDDIDVKLLSSTEEKYINKEGNITYYFEDPKTMGIFTPKNVSVELELSKGDAKKIYQKSVPIGWDKTRVRELIEREIYPEISEEKIRQSNPSLNNVSENLMLPYKLDKPNSYVSIKWKSSDESVLKISDKNQQGGYNNIKKPFIGEVRQADKDRLVKLTAIIDYNHGKSPNEVRIEKDYDVLVKGRKSIDEDKDNLQTLFDKAYTEDKLMDFVSKEKLDVSSVTEDIQLIIPRNTGIKNYDNYKFFVTSNSKNVVINEYRASVYRPLPGEASEDVILTAHMLEKETGIEVTKDIKIKLLPLTDREIDEEIRLMEMVKEDYFNGLKGENESKDKIKENLSYFFEVNLIDGKLDYVRDMDNSKNTGIIPVGLDGWMDLEKWRIFKTSDDSILTHENLLLTRPEDDTKVRVESILSSQRFGKYAEKYPEDERFKKLYRQEVGVDLRVLGRNTDENKVNLEEELGFLKDVFTAYMEEDKQGNTGNAKLSLTGTGAARLAGMDINKIRKNIYIDKDNKTSYQLSQSIITLIGADLDPRSYNSRDLVKELLDSQNGDGKFIKSSEGIGNDLNSIESQIRSMIALDMAGADYDREKAVASLFDLYDEKGKTYKEIESEVYMLLALAQNKHISGVNEKIDSIVKLLSEKQGANGGYSIKGIGDNGIIGMARVVQGLVANNINPLKDENFIKNGNTILDAILENKVVKAELKKSGYSKKSNDPYNYAAGSHIVFGALTDLLNQESMFSILRLDGQEEAVKISRIEIENRENTSIKIGGSLKLVANIFDENKKILENKNLEWSSSNKEIATVEDGRVIARSAGSVDIIVKVRGTNIEDSLSLEVLNEVDGIEASLAITYFDEDGNWHIDTNPTTIKVARNTEGKVSVYDVLKGVTSELGGNPSFITSINGIEGGSTGGWMYSLNDEYSNEMASEQEVKDGDRIVWYCTHEYLKDTAPKWAELLKKLEDTDTAVDSNLIFDREEQRITGYKGEIPSKLVIPSKIDGVDVKHIGLKDSLDQPFVSKAIKELIIEEGLETIEQRVFLGNSIKKLELPNSISLIRGGAFKNNQIDELKLPENLLELRAAAFEGNKLREISIPKSLEKIGDDGFSKNSITKLVIPENVKEIGNSAFSGNPLTSVDLGKIEIIGNSAFHTTRLTKIKLPKTLKKIGLGAFGNTMIEEFNIPKSVEEIGRDAFYSKDLDNYARVYLEDKDNTHRLSVGTGVLLEPVEINVVNKNSDGIILSSEKIVGQKDDGTYLKDYDRKNKQADFFIRGNSYGVKAKNIEGYKASRSKTIDLKEDDRTIEFIYEEGMNPEFIELEVALVDYIYNEGFIAPKEVYKLKISRDRAILLDVLNELKTKITVKTEKGSYGEYISQLDNLKNTRANNIMYNINDKEASLGVSSQDIHDGDKILFFIGNTFNQHKGPKWKDIVLGEEVEKEVSINILNSKRDFKLGEELVLELEVLEDGMRVDRDYILLSSDGRVASIKEDNRISLDGVGEATITAVLKDNKDIKTSIKLNVTEDVELFTVDSALNILKNKIGKKDSFSFREAIGYRYVSDNLARDMEIIKEKIKLNDNSSASNVAGNIIAIVAAGENPYDYDGVNYVNILRDSQKDNGKFMISNRDDYVTTQAFAVIALDMAKADYKENTIDMLLKYQNNNGSFTSFGDIDSVGMTLSALGNHMNDIGVEKAVNKSVKYIEDNWMGKNQYSLSAAIQGLISVNVDVNSDKFEGMVDRLLSYYSSEKIFGNDMGNEQAFIALGDISKNKSMFKEIRLNKSSLSSIEIGDLTRELVEGDSINLNIISRDIDGNIVANPRIKWSVIEDELGSIDKDGLLRAKKSGNIRVKASVDGKIIGTEKVIEIRKSIFDVEYKGDSYVNLDKSFSAKASVKNNKDKKEKATLIVAMYDKNDNFIGNTKLERTVEPNTVIDLEANLEFDNKNVAYVKVFLWDSLENQNILLRENKEFKLAK